MRRGDTGPAGIATVALVLLIQVAALGAVADRQWAAVLVAAVAGRAVLSMACVRGIAAARGEGLGATVAASVPVPAAVAVAVAVAAGAAAVATPWWAGPVAVLAGYGAAAVLLRRCVTRFGGITGDVLGACVEGTVAAALVVLAVA
jgi:adenosylcobinamide-GDP ribazoletransferase